MWDATFAAHVMDTSVYRNVNCRHYTLGTGLVKRLAVSWYLFGFEKIKRCLFFFMIELWGRIERSCSVVWWYDMVLKTKFTTKIKFLLSVLKQHCVPFKASFGKRDRWLLSHKNWCFRLVLDPGQETGCETRDDMQAEGPQISPEPWACVARRQGRP